MATIVVTLLIITRFYVSKMDADSEERRRDRISRREKRWSMNSQRLEQIVAELMRPIGDLRRSFDTDLSALLEQYLTEAGLHALEAEAGAPGAEAGAPAPGAPNFAELALLLQQSANIYGRKVDCLYQHVLAVSEALQTSSPEAPAAEAEAEAGAEAGAGAAPARRRRRASARGWARIALEPAPAARREPALRPPPTLPRLFAELQPRVLAAADAPLTDYAGEPVGLLQDFHVAWRLHGGLLVDELAGGAEAAPLRAIPLAELQAAVDAARAACSTPLPPEDPPPIGPQPAADEDAPEDEAKPEADAESEADETKPEPDEAKPVADEDKPHADEDKSAATEAPAQRRKRKHESDPRGNGAIKLFITPELARYASTPREFGVPRAWRDAVVGARRRRLLAARALLPPPPAEFRGFLDKSDVLDIGGFLGFETSSVAEREVSRVLTRLAEAVDSDDDGFFEQSELGSEGSARLEPPSPPPPPAAPAAPAAPAPAGPEWEAWRAGVVARAAAGEARGACVRALAAAVLAALPAAPAPPAPPAAPAVPFARVLRAAAADDADVSRLFLATLFLANAGNVEVVRGAAPGFALRLLSRDARRYCAAAADPAFLAGGSGGSGGSGGAAALDFRRS